MKVDLEACGFQLLWLESISLFIEIIKEVPSVIF
jgi:hypothetical protein